VVAIRSPETPTRIELKRVVGLPNEEIAWRAGRFSVNGALLDEPYARIPSAPPGDDELAIVRLGPHDYFVAGDNRLHSRDSRHYGPVTRRVILGKVAMP
jgi:signal peptidase I